MYYVNKKLGIFFMIFIRKLDLGLLLCITKTYGIRDFLSELKLILYWSLIHGIRNSYKNGKIQKFLKFKKLFLAFLKWIFINVSDKNLSDQQTYW